MDTIGGSDHGMTEKPEINEGLFEVGDPTATPLSDPGGCSAGSRTMLGGFFILWLILSCAISYAIIRFVEPIYQALSMVNVESRKVDLFEPSIAREEKQRSYLQTEIELLRSNSVLGLALSNSAVSELPMIKEFARSQRRSSLEAGNPGHSRHPLDSDILGVERSERGRRPRQRSGQRLPIA